MNTSRCHGEDLKKKNKNIYSLKSKPRDIVTNEDLNKKKGVWSLKWQSGDVVSYAELKRKKIKSFVPYNEN